MNAIKGVNNRNGKRSSKQANKNRMNRNRPLSSTLHQLFQNHKRMQKKLRKVRVKVNRLLTSQSRVTAMMKAKIDNDRRARTRTFIQAGSLLNLAGLLQICQIKEGEDLQFDIESRDKAATLLGILLDAALAIPNPLNAGQMETWRESGTRLLKQRAAQVTYQKRKG